MRTLSDALRRAAEWLAHLCGYYRFGSIDSEGSKTRQWIDEASFARLEQRVLSLDEKSKPEFLSWARSYYNNGCDPVKLKWAVAIIGTLAPEELDDDESILDAEILDA